MAKKMLPLVAEEEADLLVDLTFHNLPANLLREFVWIVVKPYYSGSLSEAVKGLMEKAVVDQKFLQDHIKIE